MYAYVLNDRDKKRCVHRIQQFFSYHAQFTMGGGRGGGAGYHWLASCLWRHWNIIRADYGPNQVKAWLAGQKYETWHSYSFDTTEQFQKGSPKIVVNFLSENHILRNHGNAKNLNQ